MREERENNLVFVALATVSCCY